MKKKLLCFFTAMLLVIPVTSCATEPQITIKDFSELIAKYKFFHYLAWKISTDQIMHAKENSTPVVEFIGPHSQKCDDASVQAVRKMQKLYAESALPTKLNIIYADDGDREWLGQKTRAMLNPAEIQMVDQRMINPESINAHTKEAVIWFENSCSASDQMSITGAGTAHGYTHAIQKLQFTGTPQAWGTWGKAPRWLLEGGATFSENFIALGNDIETWNSAPQFHNAELKQYDLAFYEDFLSYDSPAYSWDVTDKYPAQRAYDIGALVCEMLIAIKGPSSIIDLYADFSHTQNFEVSFTHIYGVSWSYAKPKIAFALYKFIQETS